ncbi:MAG: DUF4421 domain-containing protein [Paludibacteraceae bacterium]|nr:DUF4421 domain-containing protein [Paludibacteraceae bacterium]
MRRFALTLLSIFIATNVLSEELPQTKDSVDVCPSDTAFARVKLKQRIQDTKIAHTTRNIVDRVIDRYTTQNSTDTLFVTKNDYRLIVRPGINAFSGLTLFNWESSNEVLPGNCRIISDPVVKAGLSLGYRSLSIGYDIDISSNKKKKGLHNYEFNLSYLGQTFGIDFSINLANSHKLKFSGDQIKLDSRELDSWRWQLNNYYVFNHRKFSYPAALTQSYKQEKSAGSVLAGLSLYSLGIENIGITFPAEMIESLGSFNLPQKLEYFSFNLNAGYAHNWVTYQRHVLLHFSIMPDIGLYKRNKITPDPMIDEEKKYISYGGVCRFSSLWQLENHYIGLVGTINFHTISSLKPIWTLDSYSRIGIFYGFRAYKYK